LCQIIISALVHLSLLL